MNDDATPGIPAVFNAVSLVKECQYIEGDKTTPEAMCRQPVKTGSMYCPTHHALCVVPMKLRPAVRGWSSSRRDVAGSNG